MLRRALLALLIACSCPAIAAIPDGVEPLALGITLNGKDMDDAGVFWAQDGDLFAEPAEWQRIGILLNKDEQALASIGAKALGVAFTIQDDTQTVTLTVPGERRPMQTIKADAQDAPPLSPVASGVLINYDLAGFVSERSQGLSLAHEVRVGGPAGVLTTSGQLNWNSEGGASYVRGDTRWQYDDNKRQVTYQVGDIHPNSASVAIGGIRIAKDPAALDPLHPVYPVPTIGGVAVDAGKLKILANQRELSQQDIEAGPFTLEKVPLPTGRSSTQILLRDQYGREQLIDRGSLYFSQDVLRKGLTTWEVAAGKVRTGMNDYGKPGVTAAIAHGVSDRWTIKADAQASKEGRNVGIGSTIVAGSAGVVSAHVSQSTSEAGKGKAVAISYDYQGPTFGVSLSHEKRSDNYWELGNLSPRYTPILQQDQALVRFRTPNNALTGTVGYTDMRTKDDRFRFASANLAYQKGAHSVLVGGTYDLEKRSPGVEVGYRYNFGQGNIAASVRRAPDLTTTRLTGQMAGIAANGDPYQLGAELQTDSRGNRSASVRGSRITQTGQWRAEVGFSNGNYTLSGGYAGAIHIGSGGITRLSSVSDAYAVVRIPGVPNIPIKVNNRVVGKTNAKGELVVGPLTSLVGNKISIDDTALPVEVSLDNTEIQAVAKRQQGALIEFPVAGMNTRTITVTRAGKEIEAGATSKSDTEEGVVGYNGELFLEKPMPGQVITITTDAGVCKVTLPDPLPTIETPVTVECVP